MSNCPICDDGKLITKISSAGEESYCGKCRRIIASATLGFVFTAAGDDGVEECKGPDNDPRPGYKGPGKRAKCHLYDPGDDEQKDIAMQRAKNSAYSSQHRKGASKIINATAGFTLNDPGYNLIGQPREGTGSPNTLQSSGGGPAVAAEQSAITRTSPVGVTAPNGIQPNSNQNANSLGSGTTAKKTVIALFEELNGREVGDYMGMPLCTACNAHHYGECKIVNQTY
jgi:hypothetical protein